MIEALLVAVSLSLSYVWVSVPELRGFSLQLTAILFLVYFVSKRVTGKRWHHILPSPNTFEDALLTMAVAIVIGSTGSLTSPFLPLFHLILFMSVLTLTLPANLIKMVGLCLFLWATSFQPLTSPMLVELLSLPFLTPLMVLARWELEEAKSAKQKQRIEAAIFSQEESTTLLFITTFLKPKLHYLKVLLQHPQENTVSSEKQIALIEGEIESLLEEISANQEMMADKS